jgi:hypothetical protein
MTLEPHPHIKNVRIETDPDSAGEVGTITIVTTDLVLSDLSPRHDPVAVAELVDHIQGWQAQYSDRKMTIEGVT